LDIARSYIGILGDSRGKRFGSDYFLDIYNVAYDADMMDKKWGSFASSIKTVGKKPNSWCGIFATAMNRKGGLTKGHWARWDVKPGSQPVGFASSANHGAGFQPGDILIIKDKDPKKPLNHHCVCESINGDALVTIDGNSWNDKEMITNTIRRTERKVSDVTMWYKTDDHVWVADDKKSNCPYTDVKPPAEGERKAPL